MGVVNILEGIDAIVACSDLVVNIRVELLVLDCVVASVVVEVFAVVDEAVDGVSVGIVALVDEAVDGGASVGVVALVNG